MSDYTPGPWQAFGYEVVSADNERIASTNTPRRPHPEERANARLIAAAPDLYEACRALVAGFTPETEQDEDDPDIAQGLRAIAKAEGREP